MSTSQLLLITCHYQDVHTIHSLRSSRFGFQLMGADGISSTIAAFTSWHSITQSLQHISDRSVLHLLYHVFPDPYHINGCFTNVWVP